MRLTACYAIFAQWDLLWYESGHDLGVSVTVLVAVCLAQLVIEHARWCLTGLAVALWRHKFQCSLTRLR